MLLDTHYHLDFIEPTAARADAIRRIAVYGVSIVAQTLLPSAYIRFIEDLSDDAGASRILPSLGFHPWFIGDTGQVSEELDVFEGAVGSTRFIGEVGLDFSPRRLSEVSAQLQVEVFRGVIARAASAVEQELPYVVSIHTVRSASAALDVLAEFDSAAIVPVFHRFQGTSDELTRIIRSGGYISLDSAMFASKKGRAYARHIPASRILLESDLPKQRAQARSEEYAEAQTKQYASAQTGKHANARTGTQHAEDLIASLRRTIAQLSKIRGIDIEPDLLDNQERLYGIG